MKKSLVKKIFLYPIIAIFMSAGGVNLGYSTIEGLQKQNTYQTSTNHQRETTDGEMELGFASLIILLDHLLSGKEKAETVIVEMKMDIQANFNNTVSLSKDYFKFHESDFVKIINNELDEPFKSSFNILDLDLKYELGQSKLFLTLISEIPKLELYKLNLFKKHVNKIIHHLLEDKVDHVNKVIASHPNQSTESSISQAFEEEKERVENGLKILGYIFHSGKDLD